MPISNGQPIRFYKFVALTFLFITIILLGLIIFMSAKRAVIAITTRSKAVDVSFSVEIDPEAIDSPVKGIVTTTLVNLEETFNPKGTREELRKAGGKVILINNSSVAQPLVVTTRLLTSEGILFRLKKGITVPAKGSIQTEVYADKGGAESEIGPSLFTIPGLSLARQKEVYATSDSPMTGGLASIGVITDADIKKAQTTLLEKLKEVGQKQFAALYPDTKVLTLVIQPVFATDQEVGTETSAFALSGKATVAGVSYKETDLVAYASDMLNKRVMDKSEVLEPSESAPIATLESFDPVKNVATIKVVHTGLISLDPNSRSIQKVVFFGKTEEEVRRYLLSLDYVQSVEVKFKPVWNNTVPYVADYVEVILKQVE